MAAIVAREAELAKTAPKHFLYRWIVWGLIGVTITHSVYYGFFYAPTLWFISFIVLRLRKYELDNRMSFKE